MQALDRRRLLTSGAAAAVFAASGLGASAAPSQGGVLRLGLSGGRPDTLWDSTGAFGSFMKVAGQGCAFDCLTEIAADGTLRGELATAWHGEEGGRIWIIDLRREVVFHDGRQLTSDDVLASLYRHMRKGVGPGYQVLSSVVEVTRVTSHQIRVELAEPNVDFPFFLSDPHLIIHPARDWRTALRRGTGTGLYQLEPVEQGACLSAVRFPHHWRHGKAGWFEQIELHDMPSRSTRLRALLAGHVDAIDDLDPAAMHTLGRMSRLSIHRVQGNQQIMAVPRSVPQDVQAGVRTALSVGLPRAELASTMLSGFGTAQADTPLGASNQFNFASAPLWDPDRSRDILTSLGVGRLRIGVAQSRTDGFGALEKALQCAGLALSDPADADVLFGQYSGRATESWAFSAPPLGFDHWVPEGSARVELDALSRIGRASNTSSDRSEAFRQMQLLVAAQGVIALPLSADYLSASTNQLVHGPSLGRTWALDDARIAERWWMA